MVVVTPSRMVDSIPAAGSRRPFGVPSARNVSSAIYYVAAWQEAIRELNSNTRDRLFPEKTNPLTSIIGINGNCLGVLAHKSKKDELCRFLVDNSDLVEGYDSVLATSTTGTQLLSFCDLARKAHLKSKIKLLLSGAQGGDVQIAAAAVEGMCRTVLFFDSGEHVSTRNSSDIRLFRQLETYPELSMRLGVNSAEADILLKGHRALKQGEVEQRKSEAVALKLTEAFLQIVGSLVSEGMSDDDAFNRFLTAVDIEQPQPTDTQLDAAVKNKIASSALKGNEKRLGEFRENLSKFAKHPAVVALLKKIT